LNGTLRDQFSQTVGGLSADRDVQAGNETGKKKVSDAIGAWSQSSPDAARISQLYGPVIQHAPANKIPEVLKNIQLQAMSAGAQSVATRPQQTSNAAGELLNRDPMTGALSGPPGGAPGSNINPSSPTVAGATTRTTGTASTDIDRAKQVSDLQQQSSAAIPLTERIDQLSHEINSGHLAKMISESGNYLGFSSINEARSQLNKDLGQVKGLAIQNVGSDSRAGTILEGYPTDTTPENTTHAAMDYIRGTARQNLARGKLLNQYQQSPDGTKGFQAADTVLTGSTNPLMHEYLALKPADQAGFYRRNFSTPQQAQAFKDQVNAIKKHTSVLGQ